MATGASRVGWPGFGLWLKSHGPGKAFGMHKGGTRQVNLLNWLCKVGWLPSCMRSCLGVWENAVMEGMETLQNISPAALGIFSFKPDSSTGNSCAESPTSHSQTFLGQALRGPLHPWEMK